MQVVGRSDLLPPGVCFLCECTPADGEQIVDTSRSFTPGFPSKLAGVKYLCKPCIEAVGALVGLDSNEKTQAAQTAQADAESRLAAVQDHVAEFAKRFEQKVLEDVGNRAPRFAAQASAEAEVAPVVEEQPAKSPKAKKA